MDLKNIVDVIDSMEPLSDAVTEIQNLYLNSYDSIDIQKLVKLIESDAILSGNILKIANSPIYGFSTKILSVSQAVTLFGIMQINGFIMSSQINNKIKANVDIYECTNEKFNDICNIQSALLLEWYSKINSDDAKFLAPLALIMEVGKLVIANEVNQGLQKEEFIEGFKNSKNIKNYEKELLGITSYDLSAKIFNHWHFNSSYIKILEGLDTDNNLDEKIKNYIEILNVIITAVNVKSLLTKESVMQSCRILQKIGLDPDAFANAALKVKKAYIYGLKQR